MGRKRFKDIKSIIVQRGEYYYLSGRVKNIRQDWDAYTADVIWTEDYETSVEIVNDELVSCSCTCPYDRGICKHVAALLLTIEERFKEFRKSSEYWYWETYHIKHTLFFRKISFDLNYFINQICS